MLDIYFDNPDAGRYLFGATRILYFRFHEHWTSAGIGVAGKTDISYKSSISLLLLSQIVILLEIEGMKSFARAFLWMKLLENDTFFLVRAFIMRKI
jgi:hypothetical protein